MKFNTLEGLDEFDSHTNTIIKEMNFCFNKQKGTAGSLLFRPILSNYLTEVGYTIEEVIAMNFKQQVEAVYEEEIFNEVGEEKLESIRVDVNKLNHAFETANEELAIYIGNLVAIMHVDMLEKSRDEEE